MRGGLLAAAICVVFASGGNGGAVPRLGAAETAVPPELVEARVWRGSERDGTPSFPELELAELQAKPNSGIAFSGGGLRSYTSTLGYLRGLLDVNLLQQTRYITGVSGGAWASVVVSYYNPAAGPHVPQNDSELLGWYYPPQLLDDQVLQDLPERSAHFASTRGLATNLEGVAATDWVKQIEEVFLKPLGIPTGDRASFTWVSTTAHLSR